MGARLLIDARSVSTPAGRYVFRGLAREWAADARVGEVLAVVPEHAPSPRLPEGVRLVPVPRAGWLRHLLVELPSVVARLRPDVIFVPNATSIRDPRVALYFQDLFHFAMPPGRWMPRDRVRETLRRWWRRGSAPAAGSLVAVSAHIAAYAARELGRRPAVIPNGVDVPSDRWHGEGDHVLVLGGIGGRKDEETAIRAWAAIEPGRRRATRLRIVGTEPAARRLTLASLARARGVERSVEIMGTVPRELLLAEVQRARAAVSCSTLEAFGLPVAEALAIGAPVLCTALPAHRELLARARAGADFPVGDHGALANALAEVLADRLPPRTSTVPHDWSWRVRAAQHLDLYLGEGRARAERGEVHATAMATDVTRKHV